MRYDELPFHPLTEKLADILCQKTQNPNPMFFRILLAYYYGLIASQMRVEIVGYDSGSIPINIYAINLSPSGTGKGLSTSLIENDVIGIFRDIFTNSTFINQAAINMDNLAARRAKRNHTDLAEEREKLDKEFDLVGPFLFSFDSATTPAVKQHRHKLQLANCGSLNFQVDEIGANITAQLEVLHTFLELYDKGLIKEKLIKSTADNKRLERIEGPTPANMLLFGTPSKLMDGGRTEELFMELLEMGYARRSLFGYVKSAQKKTDLTPEEIVKRMFDTSTDDFIEQTAEQLALLASNANIGKKIKLEKDELLELVKYRLHCEQRGANFSEQEAIKKAEMDHRYFKALKLSAAYAFIDSSNKITQEHLENAIRLVEESGKAFNELMIPDKPYMKLAKYLAESPIELTLADLVAELPYFKGSKQQKDEMIGLAVAYGYRHNIIIKKSIEEGITFLRGEALKQTNEDEIQIALSEDFATGYEPRLVNWKELTDLGSVDGYHWTNHTFIDNHRKDDNVIDGFNLIVLDVDDGFPLKAAIEAFKGIKSVFYTTKSHTEEDNRYRILIPTSHLLYLDKHEYKEFINNIAEELPFTIDPASNQRSKKWLTSEGETFINEGELFDVLPYIPKTKKSEERRANLDSMDLDRLESWVINNIGDGNRNNQLFNYACILADMGNSFAQIQEKVFDLNSKIPDSLDEDELSNTVMKSIAKRI